MMSVSRLMRTLAIVLMGATIVMAQTAAGAPAAASDPQIDPRVRTFLAEHSSPFFWELLPGAQVRDIDRSPGEDARRSIGCHHRGEDDCEARKGGRSTLPTSYGAFSRPTNALGE